MQKEHDNFYTDEIHIFTPVFSNIIISNELFARKK